MSVRVRVGRTLTFREHFDRASAMPQPLRWFYFRRLRNLMPRTFAALRRGET